MPKPVYVMLQEQREAMQQELEGCKAQIKPQAEQLHFLGLLLVPQQVSSAWQSDARELPKSKAISFTRSQEQHSSMCGKPHQTRDQEQCRVASLSQGNLRPNDVSKGSNASMKSSTDSHPGCAIASSNRDWRDHDRGRSAHDEQPGRLNKRPRL